MPFPDDYAFLPAPDTLRQICKAISVMEALLSPEWMYRYYSYQAQWAPGEELMQMRDGSGDEMHVLFHPAGCVINGFAHEFPQPRKEVLTQELPDAFREFMDGEPIASIGTTFCLWTTGTDGWKTVHGQEDNATEMLYLLHPDPQRYLDWAQSYYEDGYPEAGIPLQTAQDLYRGVPLNREMALRIAPVQDWSQLALELTDIGYPFTF